MVNKEKVALLAKELAKFLKTAKDWDVFDLAIDGISFQKLPESKKKPASIALIFNPLGKRKGTYFKDSDSYTKYNEAMTEKKDIATLLLKIVEKVNPTQSATITSKKDGFDLE